MKILNICPHLGGGIGTVLKGWNNKEKLNIACLEKTRDPRTESLGSVTSHDNLMVMIEDSDIVLVHFWDHKTIFELFAQQIPQCRLIFWSHKNWMIPDHWKKFPDMFINTSPVQGKGQYIWSTGGLHPLKRTSIPHPFNIGTVISPKTDMDVLNGIIKRVENNIPKAMFTWFGNVPDNIPKNVYNMGMVHDIYPHLAEMDVFLYPLKKDHYGTCEQVLGEAMASGVVPVVEGNRAESFIVDNGINGHIFLNEDEATRLIKILYDYPDMLLDMAYAARADAEYLYDIDTMISKWKRVFNLIMEIPKHHQGVIV
jgi:hypothetical protein